MFQLINKIKKFFTKQKLVNNTDQSCYKFQLTPKQMEYIKNIGEGTFGKVKLAIHKLTGEKVAKQMEYIKNIEGDKEFIFKLNGIGYTTKMSCNGHLYDITDTDVW